MKTDQNGTLYIDFSPDGSNADSTLTYAYNTTVINPPHRLTVTRGYFRVRYVNGSVAQTYIRIQSMLTEGGPLASPFSGLVSPTADTLITRSVPTELDIASGKFQGYSIVHLFGRNENVTSGGVPEDLEAQGGAYTGFPTGAAELVEVVSSSTNDSANGSGANWLYIYGLDTDFNAVEELIILNGTTPVDSVNSYKRVHSAIVIRSANGANTATNAGTITVRHTTTTSNVFLVVPIGYNQSQFCGYTIPAGYTGYVFEGVFYVNRANTAVITGGFWSRVFGNAPSISQIFVASNTDGFDRRVYGGFVVPEKTDFVARILSASATCDVMGAIDLILVKTI
jgi:hypothetical protein